MVESNSSWGWTGLGAGLELGQIPGQRIWGPKIFDKTKKNNLHVPKIRTKLDWCNFTAPGTHLVPTFLLLVPT